MNITEMTLSALSAKFQAGELTSREITEAFIAQIEAEDGNINAYVNTTFNVSREMADAADSRFKAGKLLSPLDGMPMDLKDVVSTTEAPTTAGSKILANYQSPFDATVWAKLKAAGVVLLGKTNTDEFTMGGSTETSAAGITRNPRDPERVPGGSSGGPAASVAANMSAASIGTDTGGSIRQPAHFCGITGLKVSYGRVSRWGTIPMASSLDTIGPIAKTAEDCAMILNVIAGKDPKDGTTPEKEVPNYSAGITNSLKGLKIGIPKEYYTDAIDPEVIQCLDSTKAILADMGVELVDISLPHTQYAVPAYYIIAPSEISANMSRFDGIRFGEAHKGQNLDEIYLQTRDNGFGDEVKRRILIGTYALSAGYYDAFYRKAQKVRTLIKSDFDTAFEDVDAILAPVSPSVAFKIGENTSDPLKMYMEDILTVPASLAGICGISIPVGTSREGMPIGAQIIGPAFGENQILNIAHKIQQEIA